MNLFNHAASVLVLAVALTALAGCSGNTALVGRDTLPARATQPVPDELVATVERVNTASSEIFLRPTSGRSRIVTYSADTRVMFRGREYPVSRLESGDVVAMQMGKDPRGNPHTHLIRVQESTGDWAQRHN
ncbi:MAG: hypothetical protein Q8S00_26775 [Deltaproteobacteria bacterium]|nr:hypothetical protein [Deltaproteobacteria bacterium]MDZ4347149.1 hypothetical protein [Candidatus Binatia bacterium]